MRRSGWAFALGLLLLLLSAGCGRGPGGGGGTEVTVRLLDFFGRPAYGFVAYQVGDGPWRVLPQGADGGFRFTLPAGEDRYGVAVSCAEPSTPLYAWATGLRVYQLTAEETTRPAFSCDGRGEEHGGNIDFHADASALGADRIYFFFFASFRHFAVNRASVGSWGLSVAAGEDRPVLVLAFAGDHGFDPAHAVGVALKHVRVEPGGSATATFDLGPADRVDFGTGKNAGTVDRFDVPSGATGSYFDVYYYSPEGLDLYWNRATGHYEHLGTGDASGGPFVRIPDPGADDVYALHTQTYGPGFSLERWDFVPSRGVLALSPGGFPAPWVHEPEVSEAAFPTVTLARDDDPIGYRLAYVAQDALGRAVIFVSRGWLGERTRYTFPDLSDLPGFRAFKPASGEPMVLTADALFSDLSLGEWLSSPHWFRRDLPVRAGHGLGLSNFQYSYRVP